LSKKKNFVKNLNIGEKSKFWSKINIVVNKIKIGAKHQKFGQKSIFFSKTQF